MAYQLYVGPIPAGLQINHHCNNPGCVNPRHLYAGTARDNTDDRARCGRWMPLRGEDNGAARLSNDQVERIRQRYADGGVTQRELASEYGVTRTNIGYIVRHISWRDHR